MPQETTQGYCPPVVRQFGVFLDNFGVFLDNRVGKLFELVRLFDDAPDVHLCALSVVESSDHAVVRIIPNNADAAREVLRENELPFSEFELLIVELADDHTLTSMCLYLLGAELNIRFAYPLMLRPNSTPTIALAVDDQTLAGQILRKKMFRLLGEEDLP
ncbi:MAG: acetolactate synthase [Planctomycetota bacterium]